MGLVACRAAAASIAAGADVQPIRSRRRDAVLACEAQAASVPALDLFATDGIVVRLQVYEGVAYHAVDDIKAQPGMPSAVIEKAERELIKRADVVFVTARSLFDMHRKHNSQTYYFSNVADYEHFSKALAPDTPVPEDLRAIPAPRIGFVGAVSSYKLDFELIQSIAAARPDWSVVLIGEVGKGTRGPASRRCRPPVTFTCWAAARTRRFPAI